MLKKIAGRFFLGLAMGVLCGYVVNLCISLGIGDGQYLPVMPQLASHFKTELGAVMMQTLLTGLIGVVFAEAGFVFEVERWSFFKQCAVHYLITMVFYIPFVMLCWLPHNWGGVLSVVLNLLFTYCLTYYINYRAYRCVVFQINEKIREGKNHERERK